MEQQAGEKGIIRYILEDDYDQVEGEKYEERDSSPIVTTFRQTFEKNEG